MPIVKFNEPRKIEGTVYHPGKHTVSDDVVNHFYFKACHQAGDVNILQVDDDKTPAGLTSRSQIKASTKGFTGNTAPAKTEVKAAEVEKPVVDDEVKEDAPVEVDLNTLSYEDLQAKAREMNLTFDKPNPSKKALVKAITEAQVLPEDDKADDGADLA